MLSPLSLLNSEVLISFSFKPRLHSVFFATHINMHVSFGTVFPALTAMVLHFSISYLICMCLVKSATIFSIALGLLALQRTRGGLARKHGKHLLMTRRRERRSEGVKKNVNTNAGVRAPIELTEGANFDLALIRPCIGYLYIVLIVIISNSYRYLTIITSVYEFPLLSILYTIVQVL